MAPYGRAVRSVRRRVGRRESALACVGILRDHPVHRIEELPHNQLKELFLHTCNATSPCLHVGRRMCARLCSGGTVCCRRIGTRMRMRRIALSLGISATVKRVVVCCNVLYACLQADCGRAGLRTAVVDPLFAEELDLPCSTSNPVR